MWQVTKCTGCLMCLIACVLVFTLSVLQTDCYAQDVRTAVEQLASQIATLPPEGNKPLRIGVADFPDLHGVTTDLGRFVAARLTTRLAQSPRFLVIERQRLTQVLAELRLSMSDLVDPAKAKQFARMAGIEAIVVGVVIDLGDQVDIDARVIEVEANRLISGASVTIRKDQAVVAMLERGRQAPPASASPAHTPSAPRPPLSTIPSPSAEQQLLKRFAKANGDINIRDGQPEGLFYRKSKVVGQVKEGDVVYVEDIAESKLLFDTTRWLKIRIVRSNLPGSKRGGCTLAHS